MVLMKIRRRFARGTEMYKVMDLHPEFKNHGSRARNTLETIEKLMKESVIPSSYDPDFGSDIGDVRSAKETLLSKIPVDRDTFFKQITDVAYDELKNHHQSLEQSLSAAEKYILMIQQGKVDQETLQKARKAALDLAEKIERMKKAYHAISILYKK